MQEAFSITEPKIDPSRRPATGLRPDGTPDDNDRTEIGPTALAFEEWSALGLDIPDLARLRSYRLTRLCDALQSRDYGGILLFDPLNIRYATDSTNMQLWITHNPARACFVSASGHVILWDFHNCGHLSHHLPLIDEVRETGADFFYFDQGDRVDEVARAFAGQIDAEMRRHAGANRRIAVDRMEIAGVRAFDALGLEIMSGQEVTEHARSIKGPECIKAMRCAVATCEIAMAEMQRHLRPGITEAELWSVLHAENIKRGGEWIETRILASGPRTNPWFQECGPRVIQEGDLLAFDTDLIGPYGMCADLSRTWLCGDRADDEQKRIFAWAHEHIMANRELLGPGASFTELTQKSHRLTDEFRDQRYGVMMHGVGLCDEWPAIRYPEDFVEGAYDYDLRPGMVLCVEVYAGAVGGRHGVKLEDQVLITEDGYECLSTFPFDPRLLG